MHACIARSTLRTDALEAALRERMAFDPACYGCDRNVPSLDASFCQVSTGCWFAAATWGRACYSIHAEEAWGIFREELYGQNAS